MTIAGGIMGALFHRERTGEATTVDVSLLGTGIWAMGAAIALSLQLDMPWRPPPGGMSTGNPLVAAYRAKDDRFVSLSCLQAFRYWAEFCEIIERPELADDERFATADALREHAAEATELVREAIAERTADEWRERLADFSGQWAMVQLTLEAAADPQALANGYIVECETAEGTPFKLAGAPVQFGDELPSTRRAPQFNEHDQEVLGSIGLDTDAIMDLKVRGVVA
jgi:crotonobetainyl-CoA:carnitine CoA-transferase CaiB-like acyl-CoA transferase